ncbi:uncharacterized protein LOC111343203 isoform X2 [Stylophora pistillata]|uniref:uncharacterized protein LOC111343203 isoform X2 n=1 Tax=Stylophora pistillata TaxID=50429 RepID=UPI000C039874|nr:uncharacterized protein LOC111343203 isoform X2 [Stylophora pistillata]
MPLTKGTSALKEKPLSETELEGKRRQHEENEGIERTERKKETNKLSSPQERHNYGEGEKLVTPQRKAKGSRLICLNSSHEKAALVKP